MSKRKTQLDKAIEKLDQDIAVLQAARTRLVEQQRQQPARKARATPRPASAPENPA